ncbi:uncharacterized protein LACBIDRAFT_336173 [Laccaria bicolor S238N-H82]|uniref:Predicted protein n=1 Tax=Laccaria bicolor (strain S238N-H82 / ATCC MYA-4686) TaxID=486041 RepID=B0E4L9_LACBS|nr:uncharacterized protein LACBIDRAFT_336173 [Laccaria bicolor S238N-H82]EDQ98213.1 predicted protein [Laccaria bicolor S238N-H82]|eukprot:XP_001891137.1 predicted protein [Laccaria bicolor S238N-H82]
MPRSTAHDVAPYELSSDSETCSDTGATTPSTRAMDIGTPPNAKVRVDAVTKQLDSKQRCLITNVECDEVTEYAHVLGHALEDNDGLEETYRYTLVAHPDMRFVPIHRRDETLPLSPNAFEKFVYPFEGFPTIVSHVHPRFVICNAALKCESRETLYAFAKGKEGELFNALARIARIYVGWSRVDLPNDFRKERKVPKVKPREKIDRQVKRDVPTNVPNAEHSDDEGVPPTIAATSAHRSVRAHSLANETPADRAGDFDLKKAKARVDTVAIKRCLIENTDESNALEYAHVLGRRSSNKILTALEYSWGMEHETLNVDTRYNIFRQPAIIDEYHAAITQRAKFPSLERPKFPSLENYQPPYSYTLLMSSHMNLALTPWLSHGGFDSASAMRPSVLVLANPNVKGQLAAAIVIAFSFGPFSGLKTFSNLHLKRAMDIGTPPKAKVRVDAVTKQLDSKQRCLITNVECDEVTEYAHVLGHALEDNEDL